MLEGVLGYESSLVADHGIARQYETVSDNERIAFADLRRQHAGLAGLLGEAFERVVSSSAFILGEEVERFEEEFAAYCGVSYCVGVASGTAAITLSLMAAGVHPGDEVIVPAHTYIASALGVLHAGATPVLCDVDERTGLLDVGSAQEAVTERTAAVLAVHLYGQLCDMAAIQAFADRHGLAVFEDAAQAHGAFDGRRRAGAFGRAGAFSFYPSKNLGALGDGGALTTGDRDIAERARALRDLGQHRKGEHVVAGFNERLDGLQAAFLRVKLGHLDAWNDARRQRASEYRDALPASVPTLHERSEACVYHLFPIRVRGRDHARARLYDAGVETGVHYSPPLHLQAPLSARVRRTDTLGRAEAWAAQELSLPIYPELDPREVAGIAAMVRRL
jgi:dTDP-4-amino-4,6-dideoxygalactose transaminase